MTFESNLKALQKLSQSGYTRQMSEKNEGKKLLKRAILGREKAQRRMTLVEAAKEQLIEGGLESMTVGAVADRVGIAKGTVYLYFEDKSALSNAVFDHVLESWAESISDGLVAGQEDAAFSELFWECSTSNTAFFTIMRGTINTYPDEVSVNTRGPARQLRGHGAYLSSLFDQVESCLRIGPGDARRLLLELWALMIGGAAVDLDYRWPNSSEKISDRLNPLHARDFFLSYAPLIIDVTRGRAE